MANQLKLQVLLAAVDKITRPLKSIQAAAGTAARDVSETQKHIKELNKAAGQIDGYRKVSRSLGITSTELGKAQTEAQRLAKELAATANPTKGMIRNFEQARSQVQRLERRQAELTQTQRNHRAMLKDAGIDTRSLATHQRDLTRQLGEANRALEQQKTKLAEVSAQQKRLAQARQSYDQTKALQGRLAGQGAQYAAAGGGAIYAASQVLAPGLEFGAAISKLQALTRLEGSSKELEELRNQARELGATTSFSAVDVAAGQAFLAMAGFTPESIQAAMPGLLDLSKAGGVELGATADIASNILSAFKMEASEMGRVADVLAYTTTTSNTDLTMLAETMKYMAPIAQTAGLSLSESAAAAGLLGNIGIQASNSGTALRAMLNRLAGPTKAASKLMADLGVSAKDSNGDMRNIVDVMTEVAKATEAMGSADRLSIYKTLFGEEAAAGMNELVSQSGAGGFAKYAMEIDTSSVGAAAKMAKTMADNAQGDLQGLSSAWADVGIELFDNNNSGIRDLIQDITGITRAVGSWIKANPELVATLSKVFALIAGLAVVGGTLALTIAGLLGPFAAMRYAAQVLGIKALPSLLPMLKAVGAGFIKLGIAIMTTPVGWILAAVAAIAGAGYLIYKNWDTVKQWLVGFWQSFKDLCAGGWELVKTLFSWSPLGLVINNWGQITSWLGQFWETIKTLASAGIQAIKDIFFNFHPLGLLIANWSAVTGWFATLPDEFREYGSNIISGLISGITEKIGAVKDTITGAGAAVAGWFKKTLGINSPSKVFAQFGDDTMQGLANGLAKNHDPEQQVTATAKRLKAAGAGIALGMSIMPAAAALSPVTDAQRRITEQLQPAALSPVTDAQRQITEQLQPAALSPVTDAQRSITEQLQPATGLTDPDHDYRQIIEHLQPAGLPPIPDATRTIRERVERANLPDTSAAVARIQTQQQEQAQNRPAPAAAPATQDFSIGKIEINITAAPGMDEKDIAAQVRRELEAFQRQQAARNRARLSDME